MRSSDDNKSMPSGILDFWTRLRSFSRQNPPKVLFEGDSPFHHVTISERDGIRTMHMGLEAGEAETSMSVSDPEFPVFEYPGMMMLGLALGPNKRILMLGLGGGFVPGIFQRRLPEHDLTVVELDPLVAKLAGEWFGFHPGGNVELVISDGYEHVSQAPPGGYDQIWLDAFGGNYIPPHLADPDFLRLCRSKIVEGGLVVQNLHQTSTRYRGQLRQIVEVFGVEPLLLGGVRSANTVAMSVNSKDPRSLLEREAGSLLKAVKEFRSKIGPYDLVDELRKIFLDPSLSLPNDYGNK